MDQTPQMPEGPNRRSLMKGWSAEVLIDAALPVVWQQVTDFEAYSGWNPFVLAAHGEFETGKTIRFLEDLKQFGQYWLKAQFLSIDPYSAFVWQGHFAAPFLFTVRHSFMFESLGNTQTRFTQVHKNSGLLTPYLAWRGVYTVSYQGYHDYNQALKERCESLV